MARFKFCQQRLRSPFFKKKKNSSNNCQGSIQKIDRAPSSPEFAAQNSAELGSSGAGSSEPARTLERPRLPKKFLDAVAHLGIKNAAPKTIMQLKNDDGDNNGRLNVVFEDGPSLSNLQFFGLGSRIVVTTRTRKTRKTTADADGDANNDGGDDRDYNGGGGDKNKKKGGGLNDGEGNGDGGDKAEGGDGEEKGMNKDCMGQLGFGYRCRYHAGYENGYPVEQLHALIMFYLFCSENMINYCSIMPPARDVSLMISADTMQEGRT